MVIDEAHNIMDAITNVHAAEIRLSDLRRARHMLGVYVKRFGNKLKGENRVIVAQVVRVVDSLTVWLNCALESKVTSLLGVSANLKGRFANAAYRRTQGSSTQTHCSETRAQTRSTSTS